MRVALSTISFLVTFLLSLSVHAQTLDASFHPEVLQTGTILDMELTSDGKILVGGSFQQFHGTKKGGLVRLNADGSVDETFNTGAGPRRINSTGVDFAVVSQIIVLANGKIIIFGDFYYYNGVERATIARLNADGSLDTSFVPPGPPTAGSGENAIVLQADGKILMLQPTSIPSGVVAKVVRLNSDGGIDNSFANVQIDGFVSDMDLQSDGKILICGSMTSYGANTIGGILRLNGDGTFDNTFMAGTGATNGIVYDVAVRPDNKIVLGGMFDTFNSTAKTSMVQLNSDGTIDNSFTADGSNFYRMSLEGTGSILIYGWHGVVRRLNSSGTVDKSFAGVSELNDLVYKVLSMPDDKILVGGRTYGAGNSFMKLTTAFAIDNTFAPGTGPVSQPPSGLMDIFPLPDGKLLLIGDFRYYNGQNKGGIVRLNADQSIDNTFNSGSGFTELVNSVPTNVQSDGKIIVQTQSKKYNGTSLSSKVLRLNPDGTIDNTFKAATNSIATGLSIGKDNKIIAYGSSAGFNASSQNFLMRLNADGTSDNNFAPQFDAPPEKVLPMKNGKVVVWGTQTTLNGRPVSKMLRLNEDGTLDTSFTSAIVTGSSTIADIYEVSGGKIMLFGSVTVSRPNGVVEYLAVRLLDNGSVDDSLTGNEGFCQSGVVLSDETFLVSNGSVNLARYYKNGGMVAGAPTPHGNNAFYKYAQPTSTSLFTIGDFTTVNGSPQAVARITYDILVGPPAPTGLTAVATGITVQLNWTASEGAIKYEVERSDGTLFVKIGEPATATYQDIGLNEKTQYIYRVRAFGSGGTGFYSNEATVSTLVGLEDDPSPRITVYPNPSNDMLHVSGQALGAKLLDAIGRTIGNYENSGNEILIDLKDHKTGVYLLKVDTRQGTSIHRIIRN